MDPNRFLTMLRRRALSLLACTAAGLALAGAALIATPERYTATAQVFISVNFFAGSQPPGINSTSDFALAQIQSYTKVATSRMVLGPAGAALGHKIPAAEITASNPPSTVLLDISSSSSAAETAASQANAVADQLVGLLPRIETRLPDGRSSVKATVLERAAKPSSPSNPSASMYLAVGLFLGFSAGLALALVREPYDPTVARKQRPAEDRASA